MSRSVDVDEEIRDAQDLTLLAMEIVGDVIIDEVGDPDGAGDLPEPVRVRGTLVVETPDSSERGDER